MSEKKRVCPRCKSEDIEETSPAKGEFDPDMPIILHKCRKCGHEGAFFPKED